jgi:hypothetical protein
MPCFLVGPSATYSVKTLWTIAGRDDPSRIIGHEVCGGLGELGGGGFGGSGG